MSKNHPDDNIYSILGKLKSLEPTPAEIIKDKAQAIRESVEARGSIVDGVGQVQARLAEQFAVERDLGKHNNGKTTGFKAVADKAAKEYGSKAAGERVAGAVKAKMAKAGKLEETDIEEGAKVDRMVAHVKSSEKKAGHSDKEAENIAWATANKRGMLDNKNKKDECAMCAEGTCTEHNMEESGLQAYLGNKKYGKDGMAALRKAGQEHKSEKTMQNIRAKYSSKEEKDMAEGQLVPVKGGHVHKGHYGYEVDPNADAPKKKVATGQRGRPTQEKPAEYSKMSDPFGRTSGTVPKGKGKYVPGARNDDTSRNTAADAAFNADEKKAKRGIAESMTLIESRILLEANFKRMAEEHGMTMDECMSTLNDHYNKYKMTGECSDFLRDCMDLRNHHKQLEMETVVPPATAPVAPKPSMLDRAKQLGQKALDKFGHPSDEEMLKDLERKTHPTNEIEEELNELARLAGLDVEEGNAFTGKLKSTPKGGEFELDGKHYTDNSNLDEKPEMEGNAFTGKLANTEKGGEFELDGKHYTDTSDLDEVMKLSGLPVKETVKVDEPKEEPVNAPKPEYKSMKQSTMNPGEGDTGEKRMYPPHPMGDNGMTEPARKMPIKNGAGAIKESTVELEARLAAEYESIKKVK